MDSRSFPAILVSLAALLLTGATAQSPASGDLYLDTLSQGSRLSAAEAQALEDSLRANPEDLAARGKLIAHYFLAPAREPWSRHVFWLIEHHPESPIAGFNFASLSPSPNPLNDEADYARVKNLWLAQTVLFPNDSRVLANALRFFTQPGSDATARQRLLKRAEELAALAPPPPEPPPVSAGVPGAVSAPPTGAPPPARILVAGNVQSANLLTSVKPVYPPLARRARIEGVVRFTAIIGQDGRVQNLQLISGHPLLVPAAQDAVKQWVYRPTLMNGEPVEVVTQVDVNFTFAQ